MTSLAGRETAFLSGITGSSDPREVSDCSLGGLMFGTMTFDLCASSFLGSLGQRDMQGIKSARIRHPRAKQHLTAGVAFSDH